MGWVHVVTPKRHQCNYPTGWPRLRRKTHADGSVWECTANEAPGVYCGRRWRLEWNVDRGGWYPSWRRLLAHELPDDAVQDRAPDDPHDTATHWTGLEGPMPR